MRPILFHIGSLPIYSYSIFMILGISVLFGLALFLARRSGRQWEQLWPSAVGVFVGGMLGAQLTQMPGAQARHAPGSGDPAGPDS